MTKPISPAIDTIPDIVLRRLRNAGHPMSRSFLADECICNERQIRYAIGHLNRLGWPVVSVGNGFWLARDPQDIYAAADRIMSAALDMISRANNLRKLAGNAKQLPLQTVAA